MNPLYPPGNNGTSWPVGGGGGWGEGIKAHKMVSVAEPSPFLPAPGFLILIAPAPGLLILIVPAPGLLILIVPAPAPSISSYCYKSKTFVKFVKLN